MIERGKPALYDIGSAEALETLVVNTDDAYGFPPFREMAPSIVIGQDDYDELRRKEKAIMTAAMTNVRKRGIASDDFTWADRIAGLLAAEHPVEEKKHSIPVQKSAGASEAVAIEDASEFDPANA